MYCKSTLCLAALALVAGSALVTAGIVRAQQEKPAESPAASPDQALMQKMMELAAPGDEHRALAKRVGSWELHLKMRMGPDMPWMEADGTLEARPLLDGRYVMEEMSFTLMGMPVKGISLLGYDKMKGQYISTWLDSMSTWWVTSRGTSDAAGKLEMKGTMVDVAGERPFRMVQLAKGDDFYETEMYDTIPPAGEVLVMTTSAKRKN